MRVPLGQSEFEMLVRCQMAMSSQQLDARVCYSEAGGDLNLEATTWKN